MNRTWFFMPVTITLLSRANAAALQSARWVPPSLRAATRLRMSRSVPLLSAGTRGLTEEGERLVTGRVGPLPAPPARGRARRGLENKFAKPNDQPPVGTGERRAVELLPVLAQLDGISEQVDQRLNRRY